MNLVYRCHFLAGVLAVSLLFTPCAFPQDSESKVTRSLIEEYLLQGKLAEGESKLRSLIRKSPDEDQLYMELGFLQFFRSVERMGQTLYSFGPAESVGVGQIPFLRLPVPRNPDPRRAELKDIRELVQSFIDDLDQVESTLARVDSDDVALPLQILKIRLDMDADGSASERETLAPVLTRFLGGRRRSNEQMKDLLDKSIRFDRADVDWLRGYCCLLRSIGEIVLAYDETPFWDVAAIRLFEKGQSSFEFLAEEPSKENDLYAGIIDIVAAIHNIRFELKEPERMKVAHQHLLDTIRHSRQMWKRINAEKDDDREWIPSPSQSNPFTEVRVTRRMTESWSDFLDEGERILNGELLIPFWRGTKENRGIDLHKVFHEPEDFDLVLWVHGSAAVPFIKMGECSKPETWTEFQRVFRGNFFGFAIWFN